MPDSRKVWQTGSSEMPPPFWNVLPQGTSLLPTIISGNRLLDVISLLGENAAITRFPVVICFVHFEWVNVI